MLTPPSSRSRFTTTFLKKKKKKTHKKKQKKLHLKKDNWASVVVKNLPANAGDMGLTPDPERSHMSRSLCTATIEPVL